MINSGRRNNGGTCKGEIEGACTSVEREKRKKR